MACPGDDPTGELADDIDTACIETATATGRPGEAGCPFEAELVDGATPRPQDTIGLRIIDGYPF